MGKLITVRLWVSQAGGERKNQAKFFTKIRTHAISFPFIAIAGVQGEAPGGSATKAGFFEPERERPETRTDFLFESALTH
jgi:hypothetical protein